MDHEEMTTFVDEVVANAERLFGRDAPPATLHQHAREAVIDLWMTRPKVTAYVAELALQRIRQRLARQSDRSTIGGAVHAGT